MRTTLVAVGDIMLGEHHLSYPRGVSSAINRMGSDFFFRRVREVLGDGDIVFGNLEAPVGEDSIKKYTDRFFNIDRDHVRNLREIGFDVLSVSNNHIQEHGDTSFEETVKVLKENGIEAVGKKNKVAVLQKGSLKTAFLGYSVIEDNKGARGYNFVDHKADIIADIRRIRTDVDVVAVSIHWGTEYVPLPSPDQVETAREMVDAGADIIIGGHPHVLQGYEIYKDRPIIYSLGNFVFDMTYIRETRKSVVARVGIEKDENIVRFDLDMTPIVANGKTYLPENAGGDSGIIGEQENIRKLLEGNTADDYRKHIGDYGKLAKKYALKAKLDMRKQLFTNFFHYPFAHKLYLVKNYLRKQRT